VSCIEIQAIKEGHFSAFFEVRGLTGTHVELSTSFYEEKVPQIKILKFSLQPKQKQTPRTQQGCKI
jgi:hypothetical protein